MKIIIKFLGLAAVLLSSSQVFAQQVGTIGMGDITFSAKKSNEARASDSVISALNNGINRALVETRKFTVLDYAQLTARINEQGRNLAGYYAKEYTGNAVTQSGLDYILKAEVTEFGIFSRKRGSSDTSTALVDMDFELIGVADDTDEFNSSVIAQVSTQVPLADQKAAQDMLDKAIEQAIDQLVDQVISRLFPIKVMKIDEAGAITLNYGGGLLEAGDTVLVYPADSDITDEVSGDSIATLQIIRTEQKFSIAQALDGYEAIEKGQKGQLVLTGG